MSYMQEVEEGVKVFIEKGDAGGLIEFVKEKVLESYKNGLKAGRAPKNEPSNFSPRRPPRKGRI
jgi:hypothetical protein